MIVALPAGAARTAGGLPLRHAPVVTGGARRQDSVATAFDAIAPAEVVLVHDAARPFVSADLISR